MHQVNPIEHGRKGVDWPTTGPLSRPGGCSVIPAPPLRLALSPGRKGDSRLPHLLLLKEKLGIILFFHENSPDFQMFQFGFLKKAHQAKPNTCGPDVAPMWPLGPAVCSPCLWLSLSHCTSSSRHDVLFCVPSTLQGAGRAWWTLPAHTLIDLGAAIEHLPHRRH